ncbi:MAG: F0F1 ATP synthase subunit epsilon [Clostridiales bacterium]|nr:F0F1 ATP synthase subunit epsilon [Clostridiales bacterium]
MSGQGLLVEVVTPSARLFRGEAEMLVARGVEGELGILPRHIPLVTPLKDGVARIHKAKTESGIRDLQVDYQGGFLIVDGRSAKLLVEEGSLRDPGR